MTDPAPAQIIDGLIAEYGALADLIATLPSHGWDTGTRCAGWRVRDVAGHVLGGATDVRDRRAGHRTPDQQAAAHRDLRPREAARTLREAAQGVRALLERLDERTWSQPGPVPGRTVGDSVLSLWHDTYVHADDIRAALGMPPARGPGLEASVRWLALLLDRRGWGPARLLLDGLGTFHIGEGGPDLRGDPHDFVLVATGRADPAAFAAPPAVNVYAPR
ncbi:maleylpyruvate isomerase family mycothiol-dependent enzyme [Actinomadura sp. 21ATH]|uniref:maleylpyruvate isomerase family mycothiol-dependent enzyme n=1 Tax=Actinomadura sp. 21ATH TaxID=1735444 RepID=UPI0035C1C365